MTESCIFFLERTASIFPEKVAIVDRDRSYTFGQLASQAKLLALAIPSEIRKQPIAVFLDKGIHSVVAFAAVLYSGNFYVPLDVSSPSKRLEKVLSNLTPPLTITSESYRALLESTRRDLPMLVIDNHSAGLESVPIDPADEQHLLDRTRSVIDSDPIYCMFTSGSTGEPKGVLVPHRAVKDRSKWLAESFEIDQKQVMGNQAPFHFDASVPDIYLMMRTGATLHIIPEEHYAFPPLLVDYLEENDISLIFWVPSVLIRIANLDLLRENSLRSLKMVLFCGEVMPCKHLRYWIERVPNAQFANLYGPTEATYACTFFIVDREFKDDDVLPLGVPFPNTDVFLLDNQNRLIEGQEPGELCVRGSALAIGYWKDPERTEQAFPQNPLNNLYRERVYRTGDLAKYNEAGDLVFIGRVDSQIKLSGFRIELGEIETAAISLPEINDSIVLFNEEKQAIALVYVSQSTDLKPADLRKKLLRLLPKYMVPSSYHQIPEMPRTSTGKIDRMALKQEFSGGWQRDG